MKRLLLLVSLLVALTPGCSFFGSQYPDIQKFNDSQVVNPFFSLPPENLKDYQDRTWILLAESKNKNWFYDPYSISEDDDDIVSFDAFVSERGYEDRLSVFNASSIGPYKQKIDCFGNYQWSEIFYAEHMPKQETYINPVRPGQEWGWIKIKPKTSMAYIRNRVCGRKYVDEKSSYYFLFQEGRLPYSKDHVLPSKTPLAPESTEAWLAQFRVASSNDEEIKDKDTPKGELPIFYDVIGNEVQLMDKSGNVRQIKLSAYRMDKDFSKIGDSLFQANCQSRTYSISGLNKTSKTEALSNIKGDLPNVAFNRACGEHGTYMKLANRK